MRGIERRIFARLVAGVSTLAIAGMAVPAFAQDSAEDDQQAPPTSATLGVQGDSEITPQPDAPDTETERLDDNAIVVTGLRASLQQAITIKRDAQGVVDAISAEDIGKFPDTNLAESLQRITGVSIDRSNGEGSTVTVRGFGPEFNLVLVNGRQLPTSTLGDGASAPSSRSFDFQNLASEGIAAVEVYKSGRATLPTGGIGSTINIITPKPLDRAGLRGSVAVKGLYDSSRNGDVPITPEVSGVISDTFADDKIGIFLSGVYAKRKASNNVANVGWRDGYLGSENNWGSLPQPGDPRFANQINRPDANDVYQVPQNASYDLNDIDRERINGQAVLQIRPVEGLTATFDYLFAQNTIENRNSNTGIWFNFNDVSSAWTDGPIAGPLFYSERFGRNEGKDLAYSGALVANRTRLTSLGGNLTYEGRGVTLQLDVHHSISTSKPTNQYGSSVSVGNAVFGIQQQTIDFRNYLPVLSYQFYPGIDPLDPANIVPTGNAFRNAFFRDEINQITFRGAIEPDIPLVTSVNFGATYVDNGVRSAFGFIQNDTWGGIGPASDIPDDIFSLVTIPDKFPRVGGSSNPNIIPAFYSFDFPRLVNLLDDLYGVCGGDGNCLAPYTTDRRIFEKTLAPYVQVNAETDLFGNPAHLIAGLRYESTNVSSSALVPVPTGTAWVSLNEFSVLGLNSGNSSFTTFRGNYDNWLPAIDIDISPLRDVKLRASYSHTITRADYASLQGGRAIDQLFRIGGGTGSQGNPGLIPYKSKNIDLSAEWYYDTSSYLSVGYFNKDVSNFIASTRIDTPAFGLTNPADGPRYRAAIAALGANASTAAIRNYIFNNFPGSTQRTGVDASGNITGSIFGLPEDNPLNFMITTPINSSQTANINGFEFAIQHNFWDTGFGTILNYTIVNGDAKYDNTQPSSVTQFALTGLSDSANAVVFYDKGILQWRVAYNWRDEFLGGTGPNPFYIEAYGQWDASASLQLRENISLFGEVINLTGESRRGHLRSVNNVFFASPGFARYAAGLRFTF